MVRQSLVEYQEDVMDQPVNDAASKSVLKSAYKSAPDKKYLFGHLVTSKEALRRFLDAILVIFLILSS